ncbi:hypothetical protein D3C81_199810 [compost metagenome]
MYDLFKGVPSRKTSPYVFPDLIYVRRSYVGMLEDVKSYYRRNPKQVDGKNILGNILLHIHMRMDLDDRSFAAMVEDVCDPLIKAFGMTSSISKGKSHVGGVTLGAATSEVIIANTETFDTTDLKQTWRELQPFRYLYHSRTDLNLPIMNNTTPGKGYGVASLNIPMLAVMYRYWLRHHVPQDGPKDSIYRFIGGFVLPNAIDSYLDIAFFNRLARAAQGIGTPNFPIAHPFYLTDMAPRIDRVCTVVNGASAHRSKDIEQLAWATPVLSGENLFHTAGIPRDPVTRQNEWAIILARLPYVKYLVSQVLSTANGTDGAELGKVKIALLEAKWDNTVGTIGDPELARIYKTQVEQVLAMVS